MDEVGVLGVGPSPGVAFKLRRRGSILSPYPRAPSTQIVPTLGSKVFKWYLLWAIWSARARKFRVLGVQNVAQNNETRLGFGGRDSLL